MDKSTELHLLKQSILHCTSCNLRDGIRAPVPMSGSTSPKVTIIGGGPNGTDTKNGMAWSGRLGNYTRSLLTNAGINVKDVAWMNIVCCGDNPKQAHIDACRLNCRRQLGALDAPYTLIFGGVAVGALVPFRVTLAELRGIWWKLPGGQWTMATYHPASTMFKHSFNQEAMLKRDLQKFATSVIFKDLHKPKLQENCLRCMKWASNFIHGIPFCNDHAPQRLRKVKDFEQLNLLGDL